MPSEIPARNVNTINTLGNTRVITSPMAKVMISIPDDLLTQLDAEAEARHMSRSALIAQATRREITAPDAARVDRLPAAAREALADTGSWSAEHVVAEQRTTH
jgi:predicted transcriptional regulator